LPTPTNKVVEAIYRRRMALDAFGQLVTKLTFRTATKVVRRYARVPTRQALTPNTYYIHAAQEGLKVDTMLDGKLETTNVCERGDVIICGPKGEQYVVRCNKVPDLFDLASGVLVSRAVQKQVAHVPKRLLKQPLHFTTSWGEKMLVEPGDYLVRDAPGAYYRIERSAFVRAYRFLNIAAGRR
jgi:PGDYG protein